MKKNKLFGLLGEKLGHSFSPMIHSYLGDYEYRLFEIESSGLDAFMTERRFDGINVTIPYKQAVIPYCAALSDEARAIGSVNTIVRNAVSGDLTGYNTDHYGFSVLLRYGGIDPNGKKALVLGDGGSARTVRNVLSGQGAREIVTISRRSETDNYGNIERHYDADIIINTTPVGMFPDNGTSLLSLKMFPQLCGAADLIYNPMRTKLLLEAEELGIPCANGLTMLAAQAEMASRLFAGGQRQDASARPPLSERSEIQERAALACGIAREIEKKARNIALIGMPGCGKSTAGRLLAQATGRSFIDIDEVIETAAGKTIPRIFAEDGEEVFRSLETRALSDAGKKSGAVIATGGGVVTRQENYGLLRQNSLIVYLERGLDELDAAGRPLSLDAGIRNLAGQRLHLYETWSNFTIRVVSDPDITALKIREAVI